VRRFLIAVLVLIALAAGWLVHRLNDRPSLEPYAALWLESPPGAAAGPQVRVSFLGVATLLISDGETALMTDGFFTRPPKRSVLIGRILPDPDRIARSLERAGVGRLAAVFPVHSHYDHAMDSPEVARRTGALLIGSESTANIARGVGFPENLIRRVKPGEPMDFGRFTVTAIPSQHFPHGMAMGEITAPLVPPAGAMEYKEGGSFSLLFEHEAGSLLVQGSAGWQEGALAGRHADVVLLGIGGLGTRDEAYREDYWRNVVEPVHPRCVIPIHWDDFTLPLGERLEASPSLLDDVPASLDFLVGKSKTAGVGIGLLPVWQPVVLLGAGAARCTTSS
jgi:L-ascorbate metabolism protein UlaG (beta-lactamase superfamily)